MIQLSYREAKPIYEQVKNGVRHLVIMGVLEADEKLPSVRELASKLALNPNTISRAYRELEEEGYIYRPEGQEIRVSPRQKIMCARMSDLLLEFDEVVSELSFLSVPAEALAKRLNERSYAPGRLYSDDGQHGCGQGQSDRQNGRGNRA